MAEDQERALNPVPKVCKCKYSAKSSDMQKHLASMHNMGYVVPCPQPGCGLALRVVRWTETMKAHVKICRDTSGAEVHPWKGQDRKTCTLPTWIWADPLPGPMDEPPTVDAPPRWPELCAPMVGEPATTEDEAKPAATRKSQGSTRRRSDPDDAPKEKRARREDGGSRSSRATKRGGSDLEGERKRPSRTGTGPDDQELAGDETEAGSEGDQDELVDPRIELEMPPRPPPPAAPPTSQAGDEDVHPPAKQPGAPEAGGSPRRDQTPPPRPATPTPPDVALGQASEGKATEEEHAPEQQRADSSPGPAKVRSKSLSPEKRPRAPGDESSSGSNTSGSTSGSSSSSSTDDSRKAGTSSSSSDPATEVRERRAASADGVGRIRDREFRDMESVVRRAHRAGLGGSPRRGRSLSRGSRASSMDSDGIGGACMPLQGGRGLGAHGKGNYLSPTIHQALRGDAAGEPARRRLEDRRTYAIAITPGVMEMLHRDYTPGQTVYLPGVYDPVVSAVVARDASRVMAITQADEEGPLDMSCTKTKLRSDSERGGVILSAQQAEQWVRRTLMAQNPGLPTVLVGGDSKSRPRR